MYLTLGRARPDRPPGDRVGDVLRGDRIEELAAHREAQIQDLEQQLARHSQAPLTSPESSRWGSLIIPFQPVVVRGFSKYTRMTTNRSSPSSRARSLSRLA